MPRLLLVVWKGAVMGVVKFTTRFIALPVLAMTFLVSAVGTLSASGVWIWGTNRKADNGVTGVLP